MVSEPAKAEAANHWVRMLSVIGQCIEAADDQFAGITEGETEQKEQRQRAQPALTESVWIRQQTKAQEQIDDAESSLPFRDQIAIVLVID